MTSSTERTGHPEYEFTTGFVVTMVVLTVATLLLFAVVGGKEGKNQFDYVEPQFVWAPYITAAGHTLSQGLTQFSRAVDEPVKEGAHTLVLAGLLVFYVLLPTVLLFTWRERTLRRTEGHARGPEGMGYAVLISSGLLFLFMFLGSVGGAVTQRITYQNLVSAQEVQTSKDHLINTLNDVMWRLRQHRALPASLGGGEGSYDGFELPSDLTETTDGRVVLDIVPDDVTITAKSTMYDGSSITVIYTPNGITSWTFEGRYR